MAWCGPLSEWNTKILRVKSYFRHERRTYVLQNIKTYVLRWTTIGFKQKYGHRSSRRVDMNLRDKSWVHDGNRSVFRRSQIMILCYLTPCLFLFWHKTPYFAKILDRNIELKMKLYFYCWWVLSDCAVRETWVPRGMASLRQANVGNDMKKYLYVWFSHFTFDRNTSMLELFPVIVFQ